MLPLDNVPNILFYIVILLVLSRMVCLKMMCITMDLSTDKCIFTYFVLVGNLR